MHNCFIKEMQAEKVLDVSHKHELCGTATKDASNALLIFQSNLFIKETPTNTQFNIYFFSPISH